MNVRIEMQMESSFMHLNFHSNNYAKICFFAIMDINNLKYPCQSFIQILMQSLLNCPLTLVKGIIVYAKQDVSLNDYQTTRHRVNELTEFIFIV